jgi:hypothetical protein
MAFHWEEGIEYARYIDEDRQNIEVMHIIEDDENIHGRSAKLHVLPVDEKDDQFKALLEHFTYDDIMEMTYSYNQNAERAFEEQVLAIAQKSGMLANMEFDVVSEDFINKFIDIMFVNGDMSEKEEKELLFKTKLRLFELDLVKNNKNREIKTQLRKAKSLSEIFKCMYEIIEDNPQT